MGSQTKLKRYLFLILHIVSCNPVANVCFISICQKQCQNALCLPWVGSINPLLETVLSFHVWLRPWFSSSLMERSSLPTATSIHFTTTFGKHPLDKDQRERYGGALSKLLNQGQCHACFGYKQLCPLFGPLHLFLGNQKDCLWVVPDKWGTLLSHHVGRTQKCLLHLNLTVLC